MAFTLGLDPVTNAKVAIKLYRKVKNSPELRKKVMEGSLKCCLIRPNLIYDPFVIALAANKALTAEKMITKSVYTEILFNLSISKNITPSLQQFGIDDKETEILVVTVDKLNDDESDAFLAIDGEEIDIDKLCDFRNDRAIQKCYKLKDNEMKLDTFGAICNRIAIKDFS